MMRDALAAIVRGVTGVCVRYLDASVFEGVNVYFANHTSHLDFLAVWAALPSAQRAHCVPVAARDYWERGATRQIVARRVFRAVLIERRRVTPGNNPLRLMSDALERGDSLIVFPEGTRGGDGMHPFKPGLHHLAEAHPTVPLVPVYLANLNRILPKGEILPVPLLSSVTFGRPLQAVADESRADFLTRAERAVKELNPYASR